MSNRYTPLFALAVVLATVATPAAAQGGAKDRAICQSIGPSSIEPVSNGVVLQAIQYSCRVEGGAMNGAIMTGEQRYEIEGAKGRLVTGSGATRVPGGTLVYAIDQGATTLAITDGKVTGSSGSGKGHYVAAYGAVAAMAGKTFNYTVHATGPFTFVIDFANE
ncbi:MAG: hypothetical protein AB7P21_27385 [Lautropia sp.]